MTKGGYLAYKYNELEDLLKRLKIDQKFSLLIQNGPHLIAIQYLSYVYFNDIEMNLKFAKVTMLST